MCWMLNRYGTWFLMFRMNFPQTDRSRLPKLEDVPFHRGDEGMFVRAWREIEHGIQPVYFELVSDHLPGWRAWPGIPDRPAVSNTLDRRHRHCDDAFAGGCRRE